MKQTSKERIEMAKSLKDVNGPWEMIAFLYTWRRREMWQTVALLSVLLNIYFVMRYTTIIQWIIKRFI